MHASIPYDLELDIRTAGCTSWMIYRNGLDLNHIIRTADPEVLFTALDYSDAHASWHKVVAPLLDEAEPLAAVEGGDLGSLVWSLETPAG